MNPTDRSGKHPKPGQPQGPPYAPPPNRFLSGLSWLGGALILSLFFPESPLAPLSEQILAALESLF
jgi:hypothetical protein